ncbi:hypothetical protein D3C77_630460 [compost metagenome]
MAAHPCADPDRRRKAHLVAAIVHAHGQVVDAQQLHDEPAGQGLGQVAMGDAAAKRALRGAHGVDMDPLVVAGRLGEQIDPFLGHLQPFGMPQVQALGGDQFFGSVEHDSHERFPYALAKLRRKTA